MAEPFHKQGKAGRQGGGAGMIGQVGRTVNLLPEGWRQIFIGGFHLGHQNHGGPLLQLGERHGKPLLVKGDPRFFHLFLQPPHGYPHQYGYDDIEMGQLLSLPVKLVKQRMIISGQGKSYQFIPERMGLLIYPEVFRFEAVGVAEFVSQEADHPREMAECFPSWAESTHGVVVTAHNRFQGFRWQSELLQDLPEFIEVEIGAVAETSNQFMRPDAEGTGDFLCQGCFGTDHQGNVD